MEHSIAKCLICVILSVLTRVLRSSCIREEMALELFSRSPQAAQQGQI
jgi:hypothetical protein